MAVLQSIAPSLPKGVEAAFSTSGGIQTGTGKQGLFGSIFSKAVETGNQSQEENSGEMTAGKSEAKNGTGTAASSTARLCALLRRLTGLLGRETRESLSLPETSGNKLPDPGKTGKSENGKDPAAGEIMAEGDNQVEGEQNDDPVRITSLLEQMLNELNLSLKSGSSDGVDDANKVLLEKSLGKLAEKLDELKSQPGTAAGIALSTGNSVKLRHAENAGGIGTGSGPDCNTVPGLSGKAAVLGESLPRIIDSLRQIVEQTEVFKSHQQANAAPAAGVASGEAVNEAGLPEVNGSFAKADGKIISMEKMSELYGNKGIHGENASDADVKLHVLPVIDGNGKQPLSGKGDEKTVSGSLSAGFKESQLKNLSGASLSSVEKVNFAKVEVTMAETPGKPVPSVEQGVVSGMSKNPSATSPSLVNNGDLPKVEVQAAENQAKTVDSVARNEVSGSAADEGNANLKLASIQAKAFERGEGLEFRLTGREQSSENRADKPDQPGNGGNASGMETTAKSASSAGNANGESPDMFRKGEDSGNGNLKLAEVNIGVRSQGISSQSAARADEMPGEPAKNISPEQIMNQVREKLAATPLKGDSGLISMKLHPEELGELKVHIRLEDQKLKVEVIAENRVVKDVLVQNMNSLKETLSRQNLTMEKFDVFTAAEGGSNQQFREGRQSAQNPWVNRYDRYTVSIEEDRRLTAKFLDQGENSLVDVRF